jgi:hypothetical protein
MASSPCTRCGSLLADGALAGQCPRCLGALAFVLAGSSTGESLHRAGDYEFLRELGRGGMGVVYEARQCSLNRKVAVKMLLAGAWARPELKPRFRAEAEAVARLRHPGIVTIHEVGELDGQPFFAMELVSGPSLDQLVRTQPLPPKRAARLVRRVAEAIAHAHEAGVLHRDLTARFGVDSPRIGVAGINPHAGEHGLLGTEDEDVVRPAVTKAAALGLHVSGPFPADTLFVRTTP